MSVDFSKIELDKFFSLYKIDYISTSWYYTDADHSITMGGNTYLPATIKHGDIIKDTELHKIQLEITMPINPMVQRYIATAPPAKTFVTIYLYSESDPPEYFIAFKGEITKITIGQNNSCTVMLEEYCAIAIKLPRLLIQPACNHILFDSGCGLVKSSWKVSATVQNFQGDYRFIQSTDFVSYPDNYFRQGIMEFEGDYRHISYSNGIEVDIQTPFYDLEIGDIVFLYPGCDKSAATCRDKFSNLANYLGCPYVPRKNPVLNGI